MTFKKINLCLLLEDFYSSEMPSRPAMTEIYGTYFPNLGHNVMWVSPSNTKTEKISIESYNNILIYTIPLKTNVSRIKLCVLYIKYYIKEWFLLKSVFKKNCIDIIQVRNNVFNGLIALYFKKRYNIPFTFQYSFPIKRYNIDRKNKKIYYLLGPLAYHLNRYIIDKADLVLPISKKMANELANEGVSSSKIMQLPMGANPNLFSSSTDSFDIRSKYNLTNYHVILYVGSLDKLRSLDLVINAFSIIKDHQLKVKLLMVGEGNDAKTLQEQSIDLGLYKDIIFTGQVPYFEVPKYIAAADVCVSPIPPKDIYMVSSPTKLFEYMVMSKPIVANEEIPEQQEVVKESGCGILVQFLPEAFAEAIVSLLKDGEKSKRMGENGLRWIVENRSYDKMAQNLEKKYLELLKKGDK